MCEAHNHNYDASYRAIYADTSPTILAIYISTQVSSCNCSIVTTAGGMSITLAWLTLCSIRWSSSTPWKLIVQWTTVVTVGTTSVMLALTLCPLQYTNMEAEYFIYQLC